jgi:hypothetical protein
MELIVVYLVMVVVLQGLFAIRAPHQDAPTVFALCLFWPVSIVLIALMFLLQVSKWDINVAESHDLFGFRRPTNPNVRGFAVSLFNTEFRFYKARKD